MAGMGASIEDCDFHVILLGSLPELYRPILLYINAVSRKTQTPLTSNELMTMISEEYERHQLTDSHGSKKGGNSALVGKSGPGRGKRARGLSKENTDITCFNCKRKGHYKTDCWRPGGGKEGQGLNQRKRGGHAPKEGANSAASGPTPDNYAFATSSLSSVAKQLKVPVER